MTFAYPELGPVELLPYQSQTVVDPFELEQEEEECVVLVHALLADDPVKWVLRRVLKTHVFSDLDRNSQLLVFGLARKLTFEMVKKKLGFR